MARKKKEVAIEENSIEKEINTLEEEEEAESLIIKDDEEQEETEEVVVEKPTKKTIKSVFDDENFEVEGDPVDVPLDETIYKPTKVGVKQIVEDGTYKITEVDLQRKQADLSFGLDELDVLARETAHWNNVNDKKGTRTVGSIVLSKIFTIFNLLCFGVAGWLISVGAFTKCFFIIIVTANVIIGIVQDLRAKAMIDKLSILSAPTVFVLREGEQQEIEVKNIVVDDIMLLSNGKQICSDSVVIEGFIEVNESLLTGESDAILKKPGDILYSGSFVVSGACKARVEKVGEENYIQKLTKQARKYEKPKSEIMRSLNIIIRTVGILIFILGPIYFLKCYGRKMGLDGAWFGTSEYSEAVTTTAGAIIGMIPSGLFLLTSVALATSVVKLAHNKTLVQELYCIEMLARVNVLCLDKTGTITDGTMTVKGLIEYKNETGYSVKQLVSAILNAQKDDNLTSKALEEKFGTGKKLATKKVIPFSSSRKYSITEFDKVGCILLGAPEFILKDKYANIEADVNRNAKMGYRVLLIAKGEKIKGEEITGEVDPLALILIEDTIRPDAADTIKYFKDNGVSVKVISGDNPITVSKVSERAGIEGADRFISLDGLADKDVIKAATKYNVFGRVSPAQKKLLVKTLKTEGNTVAMTGDGVNDILALKEADCSIAMASGSEAARNVSHLVLMDSNFSSLPKVVSEGRRVINNVQRVSTLFLTKTIFSTLLLFFVVIFPFMSTYPLDPGQLYMIDFLVVGIPSFFLALEVNRNRIEGSFIKNVLRTALPGAIVIVIFALLTYWVCDPAYGWGKGITQIMNEKTLNYLAEYITKYRSSFNYINVNGLTNEEIVLKAVRTTLIVISTTFTCFLVLFRVCKPFNYLRAILWTIALTIAFFLICTIPWFFGILPFWKLGIVGALLLIILLVAAYPSMIILSETKRWFKDRIANLSEWMGHIDEN